MLGPSNLHGCPRCLSPRKNVQQRCQRVKERVTKIRYLAIARSLHDSHHLKPGFVTSQKSWEGDYSECGRWQLRISAYISGRHSTWPHAIETLPMWCVFKVIRDANVEKQRIKLKQRHPIWPSPPFDAYKTMLWQQLDFRIVRNLATIFGLAAASGLRTLNGLLIATSGRNVHFLLKPANKRSHNTWTFYFMYKF